MLGEAEPAGEITAGTEHIGGPYSITVRDCNGKRRAGNFHTHPKGDSEPSWFDIVLWDSGREYRMAGLPGRYERPAYPLRQ